MYGRQQESCVPDVVTELACCAAAARCDDKGGSWLAFGLW
jgi:hypothetical protein